LFPTASPGITVRDAGNFRPRMKSSYPIRAFTAIIISFLAAGGNMNEVKTYPKKDFNTGRETLKNVVARTKAILINSPSNSKVLS
jgi:aspartate/methionine/tyrosine aminotransferase